MINVQLKPIHSCLVICLSLPFWQACINLKADPILKSKKVVFLIDRTVLDRNALLSETQEAFDALLNRISFHSEENLGNEISLVFADDAGERANAWILHIPTTFGVQKNNLNRSIRDLKLNMKQTIGELKSDEKKYKRSMLVEAVSRILSKFSDDDLLVFISDMAVVDQSGNNFEKGQFMNPSTISFKGSVQLRRIGREGQRLEQIKLVEAWWKDALYGTKSFQKLKPTQSDKNRSNTVNTTKESHINLISS